MPWSSEGFHPGIAIGHDPWDADLEAYWRGTIDEMWSVVSDFRQIAYDVMPGSAGSGLLRYEFTATFEDSELLHWLMVFLVHDGNGVEAQFIAPDSSFDRLRGDVEPYLLTLAEPPYPPPVTGQHVYDYAGVFKPETIAKTEEAIRAIKSKSGAEIVVYTQLKPDATTPSTEEDAATLMEQWQVGGNGRDGLVILWNMDETLVGGQVQLYAGQDFRARLPDERRQAIFDRDMLPLLRQADLDGAVLTAMARLAASMTPLQEESATTPASEGP
jgi:hypothetical protein